MPPRRAGSLANGCQVSRVRRVYDPRSTQITVTIRLKITSAPATPDRDLIRKGLYSSSGGTDAVPIGARPGSEYFKGSLDEAGVQVG